MHNLKYLISNSFIFLSFNLPAVINWINNFNEFTEAFIKTIALIIEVIILYKFIKTGEIERVSEYIKNRIPKKKSK